MLQSCGIEPVLSETMQVDVWRKYMALTAASGTTSLTRQTIGPVLGDPDTRAIYLGCVREVEALARASGVPLPENVIDETVERADKIPPSVKPSMLLDLERGRPLDLETFQGTAVRLGKKLGVPTPVNTFIYAALKLHAGGT